VRGRGPGGAPRGSGGRGGWQGGRRGRGCGPRAPPSPAVSVPPPSRRTRPSPPVHGEGGARGGLGVGVGRHRWRRGAFSEGEETNEADRAAVMGTVRMPASTAGTRTHPRSGCFRPRLCACAHGFGRRGAPRRRRGGTAGPAGCPLSGGRSRGAPPPRRSPPPCEEGPVRPGRPSPGPSVPRRAVGLVVRHGSQ